MKVFLIGYMGSGKTTIGRKLASQLGYRFVDTDKWIEEQYGASVATIFEREGEAFFRASEREALERLTAENEDLVVATGGGMACAGDNMEVMNAAGMTLYLRMRPENLASRLRGGQDKRPIIRGKSEAELLEFIGESLACREPAYMKASVVVECDGASDDYICGYAEKCVGWVAKQKADNNV